MEEYVPASIKLFSPEAIREAEKKKPKATKPTQKIKTKTNWSIPTISETWGNDTRDPSTIHLEPSEAAIKRERARVEQDTFKEVEKSRKSVKKEYISERVKIMKELEQLDGKAPLPIPKIEEEKKKKKSKPKPKPKPVKSTTQVETEESHQNVFDPQLAKDSRNEQSLQLLLIVVVAVVCFFYFGSTAHLLQGDITTAT